MTKKSNVFNFVNNHTHFDFLYDDFDIKTNNKRYFLMYGGGLAGKSYAVATNILYRAITDNIKVYALRKVSTVAEESVHDLFLNLIESMQLRKLFNIKVNIKKKQITIYKSNNKEDKSVIISAGLDKTDKLKSISDIDIMWFEEFAEFTKEDFEEAVMRLRGDYHSKRIYMTMNPVTSNDWIKDYFFTDRKVINNAEDKSKYMTTAVEKRLVKNWSNILCNPFATEEQVETYQAKVGIDREVFYLGKFGVVAGQVFTNVKEIFDTEEELREKLRKDKVSVEEIYGMDFGVNDPNTIIKSLYSAKTQTLYVVDEFYKGDISLGELAREIKKRGWTYRTILADSAGKQEIQTLNIDFGLKNIKSVKKTKISEGVKFMQKLNIVVLSKCSNTLHELKSYSNKGNDKYEGLDHAIDAIRYSLTERSSTYKPYNFTINDFTL